MSRRHGRPPLSALGSPRPHGLTRSRPFTDAESRAALAPHFTNLDRPVFALVNLPETVKGALFARYSRYPGTLRRLFLDEFADSLPEARPTCDGAEGERAAELYERIFLGYGDDSVAQLGGAHIACEWTSNLLTKILQRPRLAAYLEQSTRYIAYDTPARGFGYRYHRDPRFGPEYERRWTICSTTYTALLPRVSAWVDEQVPARRRVAGRARARSGRRRSTSCAASCRRRRSRTWGSTRRGQTYEQLVLHLLAHPLAEARAYGEMLLEELQAVMPSFVARVPRPDRGGRWIEYLRERDASAGALAATRLGLDAAGAAEDAPVRAPAARRTATRTELLAALLYEAIDVAARSEARVRLSAPARPDGARGALPELVGERENRRHRPGPRLRDAALPLRDRLRLRRVPRPAAPPPAHVPVAAALAASRRRRAGRGRGRGLGAEYERALDVSRAEYERLVGAGLVGEAPYALCLAYRIRYVLELDAREALHLIELRSGREGHPSYRAVAHEMHRRSPQVHPDRRRGDDVRRHRPSRASSGSSPRCARRRASTASRPASPARRAAAGSRHWVPVRRF